MASKNRQERIRVDPEFKKMLLIKKIEYGEKSLAAFTKKAAKSPEILLRETDKTARIAEKTFKKKNQYYESLF